MLFFPMSVLRFLMRITDNGEWITRLSSDFLMRGLVFPVRVSDFFQTSRYGYLSVEGLIYTTGRVMSDGLVLRDADELSGLCVFFWFFCCCLLSVIFGWLFFCSLQVVWFLRFVFWFVLRFFVAIQRFVLLYAASVQVWFCTSACQCCIV